MELSAVKPRDEWVDTAKGIAIVLVVFFHSVRFLDDLDLAGVWGSINAGLDTFRMPLFFFTAGLFAVNALSGSFSLLFWKKMATLLWLYAVWSLVWSVSFQFIPWLRSNQAKPELIDWFSIWVWPNTSTWFIYAVPIYFAISWIIRRLPIVVQFALGVLLSLFMGVGGFESGNTAVDKIGRYYIFFLLAVHTGHIVRRRVARVKWWMPLVIWVLYFVVTYVLQILDAGRIIGINLLISCLALAAGVTLSVAITKLRISRSLQFLGRRTLVIYLFHFYPVLIAVVLISSLSGRLVFMEWVNILAPVLAFSSIGLALMSQSMLSRIPGVLSLPTWLDRVRMRHSETR